MYKIFSYKARYRWQYGKGRVKVSDAKYKIKKYSSSLKKWVIYIEFSDEQRAKEYLEYLRGL